MGGIVLGILVWQEGGEAVGRLIAVGAVAMVGLAWWLVRRKRAGKSPLLDPDLFASKPFRIGISQQMMQQIALGGTMIALPIFLQMVLEYNAMEAGLSIAPLSLSMFAVALIAGKKAGRRRPAQHHCSGFALLLIGVARADPIVPRADSGWDLVVPLIIAGSGLGLLVSQLNNYTLSPITEERVSEAAGVNSAAGSFGLSFGLAFAGAIMLATLSFVFTDMANDSAVLAPAEQQTVADALEDDAEVMSNTPRRPARRSARGGAGRDHPHQHRRPTHRHAGRAARAAPRRRCSVCSTRSAWRASPTRYPPAGRGHAPRLSDERAINRGPGRWRCIPSCNGPAATASPPAPPSSACAGRRTASPNSARTG